MSAGLPQASVKSQIFESVLGFLPDWVQITVLALIVLAVVASWVVKIKRKIAYRQAVRSGQPVHAAAQYGQGRGADYLGAYAPQSAAQGSGADYLGAYAPQSAAQGSGADHLGPYAPQQAQSAPQASGADFLGAYAPQQQRTDGPATGSSA
jgi:negative regulator of sigma E activity